MEKLNLNEDYNIRTIKNKNSFWIIVICVVICIIVLGIVFGFMGQETSAITYENYQKIQNGMTYTQVVDVFGGKDGELESYSSSGGYTLEFYSWTRGDYASVVICFENGLVTSKSQFGL